MSCRPHKTCDGLYIWPVDRGPVARWINTAAIFEVQLGWFMFGTFCRKPWVVPLQKLLKYVLLYFFLQLFSSTIFKQFCRILACNMAESVVRSKSGSWDRWWLGSIEFGLRCFESLLWTRWPLVCFGSLAARECAQFLSQRELLGDLPQTACLSSWKSNLKAAKETLGFSGLHISSRGFQLWAIIGVVWS
jgi:hypothetical protein